MTDTPGTPLTPGEEERLRAKHGPDGTCPDWIGGADVEPCIEWRLLATLDRERRERADPDEAPHCVDCGVEVDGLGPPICEECADD